MPNPIAVLADRLARVAHMLATRSSRPTGRAVVRREWVALGVSGPVPLLLMYRDILGQHGIEAVITDTGVGPGALGGVPGFGILRVAASDVGPARTILQSDAGEGEAPAVSQVVGESERINDRRE